MPWFELYCERCGKIVAPFKGWVFCGDHCHGDPTVLAAYHKWIKREIKDFNALV